MNDSLGSLLLSAAPDAATARRAALFMTGLLLAGCAATPSAAPPDVPVEPTPQFRQSTATGAAVGATWWQDFEDPVLSALTARSQAANLDVRIAVQRVRQARAGLEAASSRLWPTVSLTGSASDQRTGLPDEVKRGSPDTRALRGAIDLGWEIDVFGAARAGADAAESDARAAEAGAGAAQLLVTTEVARQYIIWQGARARVAKVQSLLKAQADTERLTRSREAAGQASRFDVSRAAAETQALAAQVPPLQSLVAVTEHQLSVLVGANPSQPLPELNALTTAALPVAPQLSPGQPAELLLRRPDLQVAERQWQAETARLRESQADQWPKFFLAAVLGRQDLRLNLLDLSPVRYSNVAVAFTAPLFNAGRLRAAVERQSARERVALLQVERAVLVALQDVENSLVALRGERERDSALRATTELRRTGVRHAESLVREGQIDLLQLLDAQRGLLAAELAAIDSETQIALGTVQLIKAVGGGWSPERVNAAVTAGMNAPGASLNTPASTLNLACAAPC